MPDTTTKVNPVIPLLDSAAIDKFAKEHNLVFDSVKVDLNTIQDSTNQKASTLDTLVSAIGSDSISFDMKTKLLKIYGNSKLNYKVQKLSADYIELNLESGMLEAHPKVDSANKMSNFPVLVDAGEEYYGKIIKYNFKTQKGVIDMGETKMSEGFYFGNKIKRISSKSLFVQDGCYTTCDEPHPHYYFGSPRMKVEMGEKIYVDPLIFYVEDMPIFVVPFGFYLPNKKGRQSGLIVPGYFFSNDRGVVLENLGYYWAASDYWDTQLGVNYYSKGGAILKNTTRLIIGDNLNANVTMQYGKTRQKPDNPYSNDWSFSGSYYQRINPMENINGSVNFASQDFNRNTQTNMNDRITQNVTSNIGYSRTFENKTSMNLSYQRSQNIITNEYNQSIPLSYSMPNFYPFKQMSFVPRDSWVRDITFKLNTNGTYSNSHSLYFQQKLVDTTLVTDTTFRNTEKKFISYSPSLLISPKFGFFTVSPSISLGANTFFRKLTRTINQSDSSIVNTYQNGLFWEYFYNLGLSVSTKLYGMMDSKHKLLGFINPESLGIKAFRHTYNPSVSFTFSPDFSDRNYGFYDEYFDPNTQQYVRYSRFADEGGSHASSILSKSLNYNDMHSFEIKLPSANDSIPEKKIELLRLNLGTSYNFAADSLRFAPVRLSFRSPALDFLNFTGNATFTLYDEDNVFDITTGEKTSATKFVDKFLVSEGKGLMRLTNVNFSFSTSFSSQGLQGSSSFGKDVKRKNDSIAPGERFSERVNYEDEFYDYYGDNTYGYMPLNVPWSLNLGVTFNYSQPYVNQISRSLNVNAGLQFSLTSTWKIQATTQYDAINNELITPYFTVSKDMHCWELLFTWSPSKYNSGFYLRFGIKASQLKDLKLEKRSNPLYR
ncbi:MAG: hypothetical protein A2X64_06370 [Ignavibacteria bacterium GWF2_33_9]|nr:MAG: hypothetical protein A2X64_06370 [Ignavibacteria bacterium GWF2_33_9]